MLNFFTNHIFQTAYFAAAFLVFLLFHISPIWRVGTVSPNNFPHAFNSGILSNIIFKMAINGMERNIPATPQSAEPSKTVMMDISH